jgi:hypothetical protein
MMLFGRLFAALAVILFAAGSYGRGQEAEPGASSAQVSPASAAPKTEAQPDLRTDSKPDTGQDFSTDSSPAADALGPDLTPVMDLGLDWSVPQDIHQPSVLKRIETKHGQVSIVDVQTAPVVPQPVTNPPEPPIVRIMDIPQPPVVMTQPQDPLAGVPQ